MKLPIAGNHRALLEASWQRSIQHGLRRQDRALFNSVVSRAQAKRIREENGPLIDILTPELERLYRALGSSRWAVLYANANGEVVHANGDRGSAPRQLRVLQPGRRLTEAELGTTAPGCVLESGLPAVVTRDEHYLIELKSFFCASTPIVGPDGRLAGVLDISGVDVQSPSLAGEVVNLAARRIENEMLLTMKDCVHLRLHFDERMLGTPFEGLIAVHADGTIRGANRVARRLAASEHGVMVGTPLQTLFDSNLESLLRASLRDRQAPVQVQNRWGGCTHVSVIASPSVRRIAAPITPAHQITHRALVMDDVTLRHNYSTALRLLRQRLPIVLTGETGAGKEVIARSLHRDSGRSGPFVVLNCAAMPEARIETELFGDEDDACRREQQGGSSGRILQAQGGVLFLDEIGEMPLTMQARLLRVLQDRIVTPPGGGQAIPLDFDLICATNRHASELLNTGALREDLYYRINGFTLHVPPLRERSDIQAVVATLLRQWGDAEQLTGERELSQLISMEALQRLTNHPWPGNIRQLEYVIRALLALRRPGVPINIGDLSEILQEPSVVAPNAVLSTASSLLKTAEIDTINRVLQEHGGNISAAARALGISRTTLYSRLR